MGKCGFTLDRKKIKKNSFNPKSGCGKKKNIVLHKITILKPYFHESLNV